MIIRPLESGAEYQACHALQHEIWGASFGESVSPSLLWVAQRTGGIASGAFTAAGELVGFIFGITAIRDGTAYHWSDMLGVRADQRGRGVGRALKWHQRERVLAQGMSVVRWTFEPLESRNAWLNFAQLGITAREYVRDAYPASASPLHRGIGTDRLIAHWQLDSERVQARSNGAGREPLRAAAVWLNDVAYDGAVLRSGDVRLDLDADVLLLRIPADVQALKLRAPDAAVEWRERTRAAFEHYLPMGYEVRELLRENDAVSAYALCRLRADLIS